MQPANTVRRQRDVDFVGIGEAKVLHDLDKLIPRLGEPWVQGLLLADGRDRHTAIVVRRIYEEIIVQAENLMK